MAGGEDPAAASSTPLESHCPRCGRAMESGILSYDYSRLSWLRSRPAHFWQGDFSDHLGPRPNPGMVYATAIRCRDCHIVTFEYRPESAASTETNPVG